MFKGCYRLWKGDGPWWERRLLLGKSPGRKSLIDATEKEPFTLLQSTIRSSSSVGYSAPAQPPYTHTTGKRDGSEMRRKKLLVGLFQEFLI